MVHRAYFAATKSPRSSWNFKRYNLHNICYSPVFSLTRASFESIGWLVWSATILTHAKTLHQHVTEWELQMFLVIDIIDVLRFFIFFFVYIFIYLFFFIPICVSTHLRWMSENILTAKSFDIIELLCTGWFIFNMQLTSSSFFLMRQFFNYFPLRFNATIKINFCKSFTNLCMCSLIFQTVIRNAT